MRMFLSFLRRIKYCRKVLELVVNDDVLGQRFITSRRWQRLRRRILARDLYRCQIGGPRCSGRAKEVDHIVPRGEWRGLAVEVNAPSNLRSVCVECHKDRRVPGGTRRGWFG